MGSDLFKRLYEELRGMLKTPFREEDIDVGTFFGAHVLSSLSLRELEKKPQGILQKRIEISAALSEGRDYRIEDLINEYFLTLQEKTTEMVEFLFKVRKLSDVIDFYLTNVLLGYIPAVSMDYPLYVGMIERRVPFFPPQISGVAVLRRFSPEKCPLYRKSPSLYKNASHLCNHILYTAGVIESDIIVAGGTIFTPEEKITERDDYNCVGFSTRLNASNEESVERDLKEFIEGWKNEVGNDYYESFSGLCRFLYSVLDTQRKL